MFFKVIYEDRKNKPRFIFSSYLPNSLTHLEFSEGFEVFDFSDFNQLIYNASLGLKLIDISKCKFKEEIKENLLDVIPIGCEIIV